MKFFFVTALLNGSQYSKNKIIGEATAIPTSLQSIIKNSWNGKYNMSTTRINVTRASVKHVRFMSESQGSLTVSRNTVSVTCHSSQLERSSPLSPCVSMHAGIICDINITDINDGSADDTWSHWLIPVSFVLYSRGGCVSLYAITHKTHITLNIIFLSPDTSRVVQVYSKIVRNEAASSR